MPGRERCSGYSVDISRKTNKAVLIVLCQAFINFTEMIQFIFAFITIYMSNVKEQDPTISNQINQTFTHFAFAHLNG